MQTSFDFKSNSRQARIRNVRHGLLIRITTENPVFGHVMGTNVAKIQVVIHVFVFVYTHDPSAQILSFSF